MKSEKTGSMGKAVWLFILAYMAVQLLGVVTYMLVSSAMGMSISEYMNVNSSANLSLSDLAGFMDAQKFFPLENLLVGILFAWWYFKRRQLKSAKDVLPFAATWAGIRIALDFILIVGMPLLFGHQGFALSPYSFYVEQAPWIYLTYLAVFVAPFVYYFIRTKSSRS